MGKIHYNLTADDKRYVTLSRLELEVARNLIFKALPHRNTNMDTKTIFILLHIYTNSRLGMSAQRLVPH